jgi:flagellar biosynthesis protein FlhF
MNIHSFSGPDLTRVSRAAAAVLGDDVAIVQTRISKRGGERHVEVIAVAGQEIERFRRRLEPGVLPVVSRGHAGGAERPVVVAVVGPTGAGKTTTVAKLALSPHAFGGRGVGLLSLDTFRVGALEQIQTYADIAGLPLEVVYRTREVGGALERLSTCEVVLVDTPGRGPRASADELEWREVLQALRPDEVHLVLPATLRTGVAEAMCDAYTTAGVTHLLLSKLDEVPGELGVMELAARLAKRARWVADGQSVPADLRVAVPRLLDSLGRRAVDQPEPAVA